MKLLTRLRKLFYLTRKERYDNGWRWAVAEHAKDPDNDDWVDYLFDCRRGPPGDPFDQGAFDGLHHAARERRL